MSNLKFLWLQRSPSWHLIRTAVNSSMRWLALWALSWPVLRGFVCCLVQATWLLLCIALDRLLILVCHWGENALFALSLLYWVAVNSLNVSSFLHRDREACALHGRIDNKRLYLKFCCLDYLNGLLVVLGLPKVAYLFWLHARQGVLVWNRRLIWRNSFCLKILVFLHAMVDLRLVNPWVLGWSMLWRRLRGCLIRVLLHDPWSLDNFHNWLFKEFLCLFVCLLFDRLNCERIPWIAIAILSLDCGALNHTLNHGLSGLTSVGWPISLPFCSISTLDFLSFQWFLDGLLDWHIFTKYDGGVCLLAVQVIDDMRVAWRNSLTPLLGLRTRPHFIYWLPNYPLVLHFACGILAIHRSNQVLHLRSRAWIPIIWTGPLLFIQFVQQLWYVLLVHLGSFWSTLYRSCWLLQQLVDKQILVVCTLAQKFINVLLLSIALVASITFLLLYTKILC